MEMAAAQFRVRFFELLDEIARSGEEIVITKHGRPLVRVVPERTERVAPWGCMKGTGIICGDIESPVMPEFCLDADDPA